MAGDRHRDRLTMGPGAILTVQEAAALLPVKDQDARRWLLDSDLVRDLAGRAVVIWADVQDAIRAGRGPGTPGTAPEPAVAVDRPRVRRTLTPL